MKPVDACLIFHVEECSVMKLLLKEDVGGLGYCGDEVEVKDGYGRNYLIPQGKAIQATPRNIKQFKHQKSLVQSRLKKIVDAAQGVAGEIEAVTCTVTKKVGDQGKLFGSVTAQEIADLLEEKGLSVDKRKIQIAEPIRSLGDFQVPIKLHANVTAEIKLTVVAEEEPEKKGPVEEPGAEQPVEPQGAEPPAEPQDDSETEA